MGDIGPRVFICVGASPSAAPSAPRRSRHSVNSCCAPASAKLATRSFGLVQASHPFRPGVGGVAVWRCGVVPPVRQAKKPTAGVDADGGLLLPCLAASDAAGPGQCVSFALNFERLSIDCQHALRGNYLVDIPRRWRKLVMSGLPHTRHRSIHSAVGERGRELVVRQIPADKDKLRFARLTIAPGRPMSEFIIMCTP